MPAPTASLTVGYSGTRPSSSAWKCHHFTVRFLRLQWEKRHRLCGTGPDAPGKWPSSHPWGYLEGMKMWHLGTCFSGGLGSAGLMGGFDDLEGLF